MILEGDGFAVEERCRVVCGVLTISDGHPSEILTGRAVDVHVATSHHCHERRGGAQPVWVRPSRVDTRRGRRGREMRCHLTEPRSRPLVERSIRDDDIGDARRHGHGRLLNRRARRPAPVVDATEEFQVRDSRPRDGGLGVGVHRERGQSVHVRGGEPGVGERSGDSLGGEPEFTPSGVLGEIRGADPDDRRLPGQPAHASLTVAVMWSPSESRPTTSTVTSSPVTADTVPLRVSVS